MRNKLKSQVQQRLLRTSAGSKLKADTKKGWGKASARDLWEIGQLAPLRPHAGWELCSEVCFPVSGSPPKLKSGVAPHSGIRDEECKILEQYSRMVKNYSKHSPQTMF